MRDCGAGLSWARPGYLANLANNGRYVRNRAISRCIRRLRVWVKCKLSWAGYYRIFVYESHSDCSDPVAAVSGVAGKAADDFGAMGLGRVIGSEEAKRAG